MTRWPTSTLGEVASFERGLTYSKADEVPHSQNGVLRANNIDLATKALDLRDIRYIADAVSISPHKKVRKGTLLICTASGSRSHLGKVALIDADYDLAFGGFMGLITPRPSVDIRFLYYLMTSERYQEKLKSLASGTNINNLKFKDIADFPVPIPPLEEQRRIVAVLDEAFAAIATVAANAEKSLVNTQELFEQASYRLLTEGGNDWQEHTLEDVCGISSKLVDPRLDEFIDLPHIGAGNMESRTGELSDVLTARDEGLVSGKFLFDSTMVLYSKIRPYLMKASRPDFAGLCSADVYPLAPKEGKLDRDFLFRMLLGRDFTAYAEAGSARAGMPKVNRDHLFAFRFRLPPIERQQELAERIDALADGCRELTDCLERKLKQLAALKQALIERAFSGELTEREPLAA